MTNGSDPNGIIRIKQEGFFYSVYDNDALILQKHFGYKLFGVKRPKTGFPVAGLNSVAEKIKLLQMNYDIVDKEGNIIASERFENNAYEVIASDEYPTTPEEAKPAKATYEETLKTYINVLRGLSEGTNALTGEIIPSLDTDLKVYCLEMAKHFENKLKVKERIAEKYPNIGKKWTAEDDELLLKEYNGGKDINGLAEMFKRSTGSIRSRLLKAGAIL